jgi:EmrB/QacA subfamily drug resistance transporter
MQRRWQVLTVVSVAVFMVSLDLFIVNIAFPDIQRAFHHSSVATVSWVLNAYAIVLAALLVSAGRLADRVGRRRVFLVGLLVFLAGSTLCGLAPSIATLVAARVVQAIGAACLMPTSLALLLPEFPPEQRPAATGVWGAGGGVAAAAGPPLGGLLVHASWRLVFLVNLPVGLTAGAYALRLLRESRQESQERPDLLGAAILVSGVGLLALGLVEAPDWGWGSVRTLAALAVAAVALAAFWARCLHHPSPVVDPALAKVRSFAMANVASTLFSAAFAAMLLGTVLFMTEVWHDSVLHAGLELAPGPVMAAVFATPAGLLGRRFPQRLLAAGGIAAFACGCLWWRVRIGVAPDYAGEMLPGLIATGIGVGFTLSTLAGASAASLPPARFATGSGIYTMSRQLGLVLGVAIFVAVLGVVPAGDPLPAFDHGWTFMVIACLLAFIGALAIGQVRQPAVAQPAAAEPAVARPSPTGAAQRGVAPPHTVAAHRSTCGLDARLGLQEQGS